MYSVVPDRIAARIAPVVPTSIAVVDGRSPSVVVARVVAAIAERSVTSTAENEPPNATLLVAESTASAETVLSALGFHEAAFAVVTDSAATRFRVDPPIE